MGVDPIIGLNIAAFPKTFPKEIIKEILNGSKSKCDEAGLNIVGGHTIYDSEPKYGIAAIGITECKKIITNSNANEEESIILTKPIGTGIINNLIMNRNLESNNALIIDSIESMSMLNKYAKDIMLKYNASSCVDITGYGLIGHIYNLALNSAISCTLYPDSLPIINNIERYIESNISSGTQLNMEFANSKIKNFKILNNKEKIILSDAQTSGGLLFTVKKSDARNVINDLISANHPQASIIGETNKLENNEFIRFG